MSNQEALNCTEKKNWIYYLLYTEHICGLHISFLSNTLRLSEQYQYLKVILAFLAKT